MLSDVMITLIMSLVMIVTVTVLIVDPLLDTLEKVSGILVICLSPITISMILMDMEMDTPACRKKTLIICSVICFLYITRTVLTYFAFKHNSTG